MRLLLSSWAKNDLLDIWDYIAEHDEVAADRYLENLRKRALELIAHPDLGRPREEILNGVRSLLFRNHLIFYRITHAEIIVLRILHGSRDLPNQDFGIK